MISIENYEGNSRDSVMLLFTSYPEIFTEAELAILSRELNTSSSEKLKMFVALNDTDTPVGFVSFGTCFGTDYSWQINWLVVHPDYQKQGIGSRLLQRVFEEAKKQGLDRIFVETCSCKGETPARNLYEKNGFVKHALIEDFYNEGHSKVVYLACIN